MPKARDTYDQYLQEISRYPRISLEREAELSRVIQDGSNQEQREAAINELIHANLRLVVHCLKEFAGFLTSPSVRITRLDLIAEGNIGLMRAATRFDAGHVRIAGETDRGAGQARFSTYACKCIKSQMRRALKQSRFIHIPEHHFAYWTEMNTLRETHGAELSDEQMSRSLDVNSEVLGLLKQSAKSRTCMLEDLGAYDDDGGGWDDFVPNTSAACPAQETGQRDLREFLISELESLPPRTQSIISLLYLDDQAPSLRELGQTFGISSERCRQICMQGLHHMRRRLTDRLHMIEPDLLPGLAACAA